MAKNTGPAKFRVGKWLPRDQSLLNKWIEKILNEIGITEAHNTEDADMESVGENIFEVLNLKPPVQELKDLIDSDPEVNMFFHQMFKQIPPWFDEDHMGRPVIRNYRVFLLVLNYILTRAPKFHEVELVAVPIHAILTYPMATSGGYAAFLNDKVNEKFKNILICWGDFLQSTDSAYVLNEDPDHGWLGSSAMAAMPDFEETYKFNKSKPHWGFKSWDGFFTRKFKPNARPVESPRDDKVICNACESAPYKIQRRVKGRDKFWIKSHPYSMIFMLANDSLAEQFVDGTVYQAFLSALSYHRFHSPVNGKIVKVYVQPGSYYSEARSHHYSDLGTITSQGYLSQVATRGLVFIEADNPYIGLMCFVAIGMAEVSTVEFTVYPTQRVTKGQELGMFHFGGSTHCLVFRPGVDLTFDLRGQVPSLDSLNIPVRSRIATVPK